MIFFDSVEFFNIIEQGYAVIDQIWFDIYPKVLSVSNYLLLQVAIGDFITSVIGTSFEISKSEWICIEAFH